MVCIVFLLNDETGSSDAFALLGRRTGDSFRPGATAIPAIKLGVEEASPNSYTQLSEEFEVTIESCQRPCHIWTILLTSWQTTCLVDRDNAVQKRRAKSVVPGPCLRCPCRIGPHPVAAGTNVTRQVAELV